MPVECPKCVASYVPEILLPPKAPRPAPASADRQWRRPSPPPVAKDTDDVDGAGPGGNLKTFGDSADEDAASGGVDSDEEAHAETK
jgi:hypothetical protein